MSEIRKIYEIGSQEVGYLEKASNAYLDDKTKNAGYNNYTKYWRDIANRGRMAQYGISGGKGWAGGSNWPYCAGGIDDAFCRALGQARAAELLLHGDAAFINCETMYQKAKSAGLIVSYPAPGAIVLFYKSNGEHYHTEFAYRVENGIMYTIGWNTSGASSVIANGGGVCFKRYSVGSVAAHYFMPRYDSVDNDIPEDTGVSVTYLKFGSRGEAVRAVQRMLNAIGYSVGSSGADGIWGNGTQSAFLAFQSDYELAVDGIYGEKSAHALNTAYNAKVNGKTDDPINSPVLFVGEILYDGVDVRSWAGREFGNIKSYPKLNATNLVDVLDYNQKSTDGELWRFVRIKKQVNGSVQNCHGFVQDKNLKRSGDNSHVPAKPKQDKNQRLFVGKVTASVLNVRTWAGANYPTIGAYPQLNNGNLVDVMNYTQKDTNGESWYFVRIAGKYFGFVKAEYIKTV